jgi:hypothetical protein
VAGGTLMQWLMSVVLGAALLRKNRGPFGAAFALWLTGVSVMDRASYLFDALRPQLTLLSGGTGLSLMDAADAARATSRRCAT